MFSLTYLELGLVPLKEVVRVAAAGTAELTTLSPDISSCKQGVTSRTRGSTMPSSVLLPVISHSSTQSCAGLSSSLPLCKVLKCFSRLTLSSCWQCHKPAEEHKSAQPVKDAVKAEQRFTLRKPVLSHKTVFISFTTSAA